MKKKQVLQTQTGLEWLVGILAPDVLGEEAHRVLLLIATGLIIAAAGMFFLVTQLTTTLAVPSLPPAPLSDIVMDIAVVLAGGFTLWLVRSGHVRLAAWIVLSFLWAGAATQLCLRGEPPTDIVGSFGLFMVVILSIVLLDQRRAWMAWTIAAAVAFMSAHLLWLGGYLPPMMERAQNQPGQALFSIISWLTCAGIILLVLGSAVSMLRDQAETLNLRITERKQAEEALRRSEREKDLILNATSEFFAYYNTDLEVQWVNQVAADSMGLSPGKLVGHHCYEVWGQSYEPCENCPVMRTLRTEEPQEAEQIKPDDGIWFLRSYPIFNEHGKIEGVVALGQDITEQQEAQRALRESEERYHTLFDSSPDAIALVGLDGTVLDCNPATSEIAGLSREEIVGRPFTKLGILDDDLQPRYMEIFSRLLGGEEVEHLELKTTREDGQMCYIEAFATPITKREEVHAIQVIARDITERKQAEDRLSFQSMLLDQIYDMVTATDLEGRITYVNEAECRAFGNSADELIGQHVEGYGEDPEGGATQQEIIEKTLSKGQWRGEVVNIPKDGQEIILDCRTQLIYDERGEAMGMVGISTDITERKEMERQLRQQERLAAVGQLAAGIAHDFRNLLSTIILYAQLPLRNRKLSPDLAQNLQTIVDESYKATDMVQQILDFSSRAMIRPRPLDLVVLIEDVLEVLARTIPEHIYLTLDARSTAPGAYTVKADPGRIQQVLTNLTLNARDAMPEGGTLQFALSVVEIKPDGAPPVTDMAPGNWVHLTVSDTGIGMTEEVREHLFEPFFTTKDVGGGTGLGLAQVYGIIRQHKGHIDVETELGEGATFHIYLPTHEQRPEEVDTKEPVPTPKGQGETILLVEDEEILREAEREMLESLGYRVLMAANGREALALYQSPRWSGGSPRQPVDLVITDMVMPEMGGEELVRELRKRDPNLRALGITGYSGKTVTKALRKAGFLDVIHKPFEVETLARVIRRALRTDTD